MTNNTETPPATEPAAEGLADETLDLVKAVRRMTKAENVHLRGIQAAGGDWNEARTSRDDADLALADLYAAWPAKRLDALTAALRSNAASVPASAPAVDAGLVELIRRVVACRKPPRTVENICHGTANLGAGWSISELTALLPELRAAALKGSTDAN